MPRTTIRSEDITDAQVKTADMAVDPTNASNLSSGSVPLAQLGNAPATDTSSLEDDIALLGFKVAANGSLAKYNLDDQTVDAFEDASGVDASASTNETRNASNYYSGQGPGTNLSATGGVGSAGIPGAAGGVGSGGATNGTGGTGSSAGDASSPPAGGAGTNGAAGGGGGGRGGAGIGGAGGTGDAPSFTGGGGGGGSDYDGGPGGAAAGGTGYKSGGAGGTGGSQIDALPGSGIDGTGSVYGAGDKGVSGATRKNNGGGGAAFGGGGGGAADPANAGTPTAGGGGGGSGGVVFVYTNSGTQTVTRFTGTSYTIPTGSTNLTVHAIGGGGGGSQGPPAGNSGGGGGGGGGYTKSSVLAGAGDMVVAYTIGAAGAGSNAFGGPGGTGGTTTVTIPGDALDLTLVSTTTAANAAPTKGDIVLTYTNGAGTTTLDTDLTAEISADGGSTWTALALGSEGTTGVHNIAASHDITISSTITAPYNMAYRLKTLNQSASKTTRIQAVSLGWS